MLRGVDDLQIITAYLLIAEARCHDDRCTISPLPSSFCDFYGLRRERGGRSVIPAGSRAGCIARADASALRQGSIESRRHHGRFVQIHPVYIGWYGGPLLTSSRHRRQGCLTKATHRSGEAGSWRLRTPEKLQVKWLFVARPFRVGELFVGFFVGSLGAILAPVTGLLFLVLRHRSGAGEFKAGKC